VKVARGPCAAGRRRAPRVLPCVLAAPDAALERRPRVTPRPSSLAMGISSPSTVRSSSEYWIWSPTKSAQPRNLRDQLRLGHLPRRRVGDTQVAHLAGVHEIVEGRHRLLDGGVHVPAVQPIEIDVVGLQPPQRLLALGDDRLAAGAAPIGIADLEVGAELGRDDEAVALVALTAYVIADDPSPSAPWCRDWRYR